MSHERTLTLLLLLLLHFSSLCLSPQYRVTLPTFYANGLLFGTLRMEIGDTSTIICEKTGLMAELNFHQKVALGQPHSVPNATLCSLAAACCVIWNSHTLAAPTTK